MFWFKKKEKKRVYPAVYSEWLSEFKRLEDSFLSEADSVMLSGGDLTDKKYSIVNFENSLSGFLEKQIQMFFAKFSKDIEANIDEGNCEYMLLIIRRYNLKYNNLFFFENFAFLDAKYKNELVCELKGKLNSYNNDLLRYFSKISEYTDTMYEVTLGIKRLIEV